MGEHMAEREARPRLLSAPSERALYDLLATLNSQGVNPELACTYIGQYGHAAFIVNLRDPDAADVFYVVTDSDGHGHDDSTEDHPMRYTDCDACSWRPSWPVLVLLPVEPDLAVAMEYGYDAWWAAEAGDPR